MSIEVIQNHFVSELREQQEVVQQQNTLISVLKDEIIRLQRELLRCQRENVNLKDELDRAIQENDYLKEKVQFISDNNDSLLHSFQIFQSELIKRDSNSSLNRVAMDTNPTPFFADLIQTFKSKLVSTIQAPPKLPKKSIASQYYNCFFPQISESSQLQLLNQSLDEKSRSPRTNKIKSFGKKYFFNENYRHVFWFKLIENKLNISTGLYKILEAKLSDNKSQKLACSTIMQHDLRRMDVKLDLEQTKSVLKQVQKCLELFQIYRLDIGYIQGMTYFAWMFVIRMEMEQAFTCFSNVILTDPFISSLYTFDKDKLTSIVDFFQECLTDKKPKILKHMKDAGVQWDLFLIEWAYTFFTRAFSLRVVSKIWDLWFTEGYNVFFKVCLSIIQMLESQISEQFENDKIIQLLRNGANKLDEEDFIRILCKQKLFNDLKLESLM